ncbi:MAG: S41 family peptidase [Candidatus Eremiobacteraeota bacterium]|nr:S41 family peptidase [Candidatus Eremiobacteraeota bacterium]
MKKLKQFSVILILLFLTGILSSSITFAAGSENSISSAIVVSPQTPVQEKEKAEEEIKFYEPYLKEEKHLEYTPDLRLVKVAYALIKARFVDEVDDEKFFSAMKDEVKKLLEQAGVDTRRLNLLPVDETFPARAAIVFGKEVPEKLIYYACIQGIPKGVDDEHTRVMEPSAYRALRELLDVKGFGGVGMAIDMTKEENQLFVVEVFEDTPAERAGLKSGDWIMAIDGKSTRGITVREAQKAIRGKPGTKVVLTVKRKGEKKLLDLIPIRDHIIIHAIKPPEILNQSIGYIKMRFFSNQTGRELKKAINEIKEKGARALILDVRNNGGGYLDTAVDVSSQFLPGDADVVKVRDRYGRGRTYNSRGNKKFDLPMVLLVNRYSASASEILAGCLKDYNIATIIGEKTFGKGSVQTILDLEGPVLKITIQRFFTPKETVIDKVGITPDIIIKLEPDRVSKPGDKQIEKALEILEEKITKK